MIAEEKLKQGWLCEVRSNLDSLSDDDVVDLYCYLRSHRKIMGKRAPYAPLLDKVLVTTMGRE